MSYDILDAYIKKYLIESAVADTQLEDALYLAELNEAAMSAEDRHDSDILKAIIDKTAERTNAKLTSEEKEILAKYNLDRYNRQVIIPDARYYSISDEDINNPRGGNSRERAGSYTSSDPRRRYRNNSSEVNYADIARKRGVRQQAKIDAILGDQITKWRDDRVDFKNKKWHRDYHQDYVNQADEQYLKALQKARADYERAIKAAEEARDKVDSYHRPAAEKYAAEIDAMLKR